MIWKDITTKDARVLLKYLLKKTKSQEATASAGSFQCGGLLCSTLSISRLTELLTLSLWESPSTLRKKLIFTACICDPVPDKLPNLLCILIAKNNIFSKTTLNLITKLG